MSMRTLGPADTAKAAFVAHVRPQDRAVLCGVETGGTNRGKLGLPGGKAKAQDGGQRCCGAARTGECRGRPLPWLQPWLIARDKRSAGQFSVAGR